MFEKLKRRRQRKKELRRLKKESFKKILFKGNNMWIMFTLGVFILTFSTLFLVVKAEKEGLSQTEIDQRNELMEMEYKSMSDGHIGGDEKLIKDNYEEEISKEAFVEEKEDNEDFFVYFYSPYCPYCEEVGDTVIDALDESEVDYVVVDVNDDIEFQDKENAGTVPRVVKYEKGGVEDELDGVNDKEVYEEFIDKNRDEEQ